LLELMLLIRSKENTKCVSAADEELTAAKHKLMMGPAHRAFKVDIQKAYDTVDWLFLKDILMGFSFHHRMIGWIMECVTTTSFSLSINGCSHGFFKARVIMDSLEEFKNAPGLTPSLLKSTAYFCNVLNYIKIRILSILSFEEGTLPVKHLSVPLVPFRLVYRDCLELMERIKKRINDWKNKVLSFAGKTQLIRSVLGSMHVYWASVFLLPFSLMHDLEQVIRGFLWCQGEMKRGKAKVAWEVVCFPKKEGGLGIRRLEVFNKALISSHIWSIITNKEYLWVKWVYLYKPNGRSFWDISLYGNISCGWRKILQVRSLVCPFFWSQIRDGKNTFAWFDNWSAVSPLSNLILNRDIYRAGLGRDARVSDIVLADSWNMEVGYSVAAVWECICPRNNEIDSSSRYSFMPDTHEHLFFECRFSFQMWECVKSLTSIYCCGNCLTREKVDSTPVDSRDGKHVVTTPINNELDKSLSDLNCGSINSHLKFAIGSIGCDQTSLLEGIASVKTRNGMECGMSGPCDRNEHTGMEDVVSTSVVPSSTKDGISSYKDGMDFEFGNNDNSKGLLKKPIGWCDDRIKAFKPTILSNQFSVDVDRFAEKLKQGSEELALKIEYSPSSVSIQGNGNRRIDFTAKEVYKGAQACSLQFMVILWESLWIIEYEDGMKTVLDSGPWMVQNVPIVLNIWEPGIWLEKTKPTSIPIWVSVFNIPIELCNGNRIGKIMSGVGKPLVMDKMTKERCLKKERKHNFARVLVEVCANEDLPGVLEIACPPLGNRPAKIGKMDVKYYPKTKEELVAASIKHVNIVFGVSMVNEDGNGKVKTQVKDYINAEGKKKSVQKGKYHVKSSTPIRPKSLQKISKDPNFKPKMLLRGTTSKNSYMSASEEAILVKNSFELLVKEDMDQKEVDILMKVGIYPSKAVRLDWTIHQMDYFYKKCHKFCLDPLFEDDDVESEKDGIASDMKPGVESGAAVNSGNIAAEDKYSLCVLLETQVKKRKIARICKNVFGNWDWISNNACCSVGTRIIVGWDPNCVNFMVMEQSAQVIHYYVAPLNGDKKFHWSFIYAHVHIMERRSLWRSLHKYKRSIQDEPWVILGYFNAILDPSEKSMGGSKITTAMGDFRECVSDIGMEDIAMFGLRFTWNKKRVSKLKMLKKPLRKLIFEQGNLFVKVKVLRNELAEIQFVVTADPHSDDLREAELKCFNAYNAALRDEESFLRQKATTEWLKEGDRNSKYFHNVVKGRQNKSRNYVVENLNGIPLFCNEMRGQDISVDEIKSALFDIDGNKAPGPDGFSSYFFKSYWAVIGEDLCKAVKEFFSFFVSVLKKALDEFGMVSGLILSLSKSMVFFGNVKEATKARILDIMPFKVGNLPARYLGVPLISKRLYCNDCQPLIYEVRKRILDWKNKYLSFAGRLQLIKSVVGSMQIYWSSMFILHVSIANEVGRLMRNFLWNFGEFKRGNLLIFKDSLWVIRVHMYKLKGRSFWNIPDKGGSFWIWRRILKVRGHIRDHIISNIGDGKGTSLWFDIWHPICPISNFILKRKIYYFRLSLKAKVADVIDSGKCKWPKALCNEFDGLLCIDPPIICEDKSDKIMWRTNSGRHINFSVFSVWYDFREGNQVVPLPNLVWFSQCIPRHSFMMWLAVNGKLKTHDEMGVWERKEDLKCVFCKKVQDSHNHLFFECDFSSVIWKRLKAMVKLNHAPISWFDIQRSGDKKKVSFYNGRSKV
nr:hypothetical protein [Tanacetum cinerariifolium]